MGITLFIIFINTRVYECFEESERPTRGCAMNALPAFEYSACCATVEDVIVNRALTTLQQKKTTNNSTFGVRRLVGLALPSMFRLRWHFLPALLPHGSPQVVTFPGHSRSSWLRQVCRVVSHDTNTKTHAHSGCTKHARPLHVSIRRRSYTLTASS